MTLHKDKTGHVGFTFKEGKVTGLVVDSSAAKNGLLTEHNLLEINGQNVVGLKDKEITKIIADGGNVITVTIVPSYIYQHMTKRYVIMFSFDKISVLFQPFWCILSGYNLNF